MFHSGKIRKNPESIPRIFDILCLEVYNEKMITYSEIVSIIHDSSRFQTDIIVTRKLEQALEKNLLQKKPIKVITGIRRSGKSFILKRIYQKIAASVPRKNILFLNFEHDRLNTCLNLTSLREIYDLFTQKSDPEYRIYLFLDEIQNIPGWERFVRTVYDSGSDDIYITGSNSELLSSEFSSVIGGRVLEYHLQPFTFYEFLHFFNFGDVDLFSLYDKRIELSRLLDTYLNSGGICETFTLSNEQKDIYRDSLIDKILLKDIISRYRINKPELIKNLFLYIAKNPGSLVSASKLSRVMKVDDKTVTTYLTYLCNSFLLRRIDRLEWKTKNIFQSQKKYYLTDNLFTHLSMDSRKLENLIYIHLIDRYGKASVNFLRNEKGQEVDFIVTRGKAYYCFQVCVELNEENRSREFRSLVNLMKYRSPEELNTDRYILLYSRDSRLLKENLPGIELIEILEFLLLE